MIQSPSWLRNRTLGVEFSSKRDAGTCTVFAFGFSRGLEQQAVAGLLSSLPEGSEIGVPDPSAADCSLEVRRTRTGLEAKLGCHGAYGSWRSATEQEASTWLLPEALHASEWAKPGYGGTLTENGMSPARSDA